MYSQEMDRAFSSIDDEVKILTGFTTPYNDVKYGGAGATFHGCREEGEGVPSMASEGGRTVPRLPWTSGKGIWRCLPRKTSILGRPLEVQKGHFHERQIIGQITTVNVRFSIHPFLSMADVYPWTSIRGAEGLFPWTSNNRADHYCKCTSQYASFKFLLYI